MPLERHVLTRRSSARAATGATSRAPCSSRSRRPTRSSCRPTGRAHRRRRRLDRGARRAPSPSGPRRSSSRAAGGRSASTAAGTAVRLFPRRSVVLRRFDAARACSVLRNALTLLSPSSQAARRARRPTARSSSLVGTRASPSTLRVSCARSGSRRSRSSAARRRSKRPTCPRRLSAPCSATLSRSERSSSSASFSPLFRRSSRARLTPSSRRRAQGAAPLHPPPRLEPGRAQRRRLRRRADVALGPAPPPHPVGRGHLVRPPPHRLQALRHRLGVRARPPGAARVPHLRRPPHDAEGARRRARARQRRHQPADRPAPLGRRHQRDAAAALRQLLLGRRRPPVQGDRGDAARQGHVRQRREDRVLARVVEVRRAEPGLLSRFLLTPWEHC